MKRVTSLLMIFVLTTGSMSAFIPDRACKYACCQRDMDCCVGNNKMENCSLSAGTDISSLNLIASGPKFCEECRIRCVRSSYFDPVREKIVFQKKQLEVDINWPDTGQG